MKIAHGALAHALPGEIPAASQGTMNNVSIGGIDPGTGEPFTYYETMGGGRGIRPLQRHISDPVTHDQHDEHPGGSS